MIRALIVDDHPVFRRGLRTLLESDGLEVVGETSSGHEAVSLVGSLSPDVILMDLGLADLDGVEATSLITNQYPGAKILVVSMYADDTSLVKAMAAGASGYVAKDSPPEELLQAVRTVAAGSVVLGSSLEGHVRRIVGGEEAGKGQTGADFPELTPRERQVARLMASGISNSAIAARLGLSPKTVANYVSEILSRLSLPDREALVQMANRRPEA